mgnify:FL=1
MANAPQMPPVQPFDFRSKLPDLSFKPAPSAGRNEYELSKGYRFALFSSVEELPKDWERAQPDNLFLQRAYLSVVEDNPPPRMRFSYLVFYKNNAPVGVAYCQLSNFRPDRSVQDLSVKPKYPCVIRAVSNSLKNFVASQFEHNLLVCGSLLLTGEHGFHFLPEAKLDKAAAFDLLEEALISTQKHWEKKGLKLDGIFIKDIEEEHRAPGQVLVARKFREFTFHPNMVMELPAAWKTFEDYLAAITSKYRVRAKRAFKMATSLEKRELTENQIIANKTRLYELYKSVVDTASFNMTVLHENYMPDLKLRLGGRFRVTGYFQNGELVGYFTTILNGRELEAHFLGFEQACNKDCHLYHNMLFDILREGIERRVERVIYARTAMEIKSSVGAVAHEMFCYIRANNRLMNKILPTLLEYLRPPDDWVARSPFKD